MKQRKRREFTRESFEEKGSHRVNMILKNLRLIEELSIHYIDVMEQEDVDAMKKHLNKELAYCFKRINHRIEARENRKKLASKFMFNEE